MNAKQNIRSFLITTVLSTGLCAHAMASQDIVDCSSKEAADRSLKNHMSTLSQVNQNILEMDLSAIESAFGRPVRPEEGVYCKGFDKISAMAYEARIAIISNHRKEKIRKLSLVQAQFEERLIFTKANDPKALIKIGFKKVSAVNYLDTKVSYYRDRIKDIENMSAAQYMEMFEVTFVQ